MRQVPRRRGGCHRVTFIEVWEHRRDAKRPYHNSWVTDRPVEAHQVRVIIGRGRARWKIENEGFNVHKNQGYELEHNFGHGQKTLAMVFYWRNLLAYVAHIILDMGDQLYAACRALGSRKELWPILRAAMQLLLFDSWAAIPTRSGLSG